MKNIVLPHYKSSISNEAIEFIEKFPLKFVSIYTDKEGKSVIALKTTQKLSSEDIHTIMYCIGCGITYVDPLKND